MRKVVCAVLRRADGRILLARRAPCQHLEGYWELPGGKVEPGESPESALQRELLEELGLVVSVGQELARTVYHYDRGSIELIALPTTTSGEVTHMVVHDAIEWFAAAETRTFHFAPAASPLLKSILETPSASITVRISASAQ